MGEKPISAASYVIEPPTLWSSAGVKSGPRWDDSADAPGWVIGDYHSRVWAAELEGLDEGTSQPGSASVRLSELPADVFEAAGRLAAQDRAGIAAEVLYPTPKLWGAIGLALEAETEIACVQIYNDWLAEFVGTAPDRLIGVAQIPSQGGVDAAVEELRRASELGLKGFVLRAYPTGNTILSADDDKFWAEVVECRGVLSFDTSFGPALGDTLSGAMGPSAGGPLMHFVYQGVVDRFPTMSIVVNGPTASWIPYWLERIDDRYLRFPATQNNELLRQLPSDYLRKRPFFTFSGNDPILAYPDDYISFSHLMWSSQYPTFFSVDSEKASEGLDGLDSTTREKIMGNNCRDLYQLSGANPIDLEPSVKPLPHAVPV